MFEKNFNRPWIIFRLDFQISDWIFGFQSGFLDSVWISDFIVTTVYKISFVTDPLYASVNHSASFHTICVTGCLFGKLAELSCHSGCLWTIQPASKPFSQLSNCSAWFLNETTLFCIIESGPKSLKTRQLVYKPVACCGQVCNQFATYTSWHIICALRLDVDWFIWPANQLTSYVNI